MEQDAHHFTGIAATATALWLTAAALTGLAFTGERGLALPAVFLFAAGAVAAFTMEHRDELWRYPVRGPVWPPADDPPAPPQRARIWRPARPS